MKTFPTARSQVTREEVELALRFLRCEISNNQLARAIEKTPNNTFAWAACTVRLGIRQGEKIALELAREESGADTCVKEVTLSVRVPEAVRQGLASLAVRATAAAGHRVTIQNLTREACESLLRECGAGDTR